MTLLEDFISTSEMLTSALERLSEAEERAENACCQSKEANLQVQDLKRIRTQHLRILADLREAAGVDENLDACDIAYRIKAARLASADHLVRHVEVISGLRDKLSTANSESSRLDTTCSQDASCCAADRGLIEDICGYLGISRESCSETIHDAMKETEAELLARRQSEFDVYARLRNAGHPVADGESLADAINTRIAVSKWLEELVVELAEALEITVDTRELSAAALKVKRAVIELITK